MKTFPIALLLALLLCGSGTFAQEDSGPPKPPPTFVELTSVQVKKVKDAWQLRLVGKATDLPAKSVIEFEIRWRTNIVYAFQVALDSSGLQSMRG